MYSAWTAIDISSILPYAPVNLTRIICALNTCSDDVHRGDTIALCWEKHDRDVAVNESSVSMASIN